MRWSRLITPLALLVIWQAASWLGWIPAYKLPSPLAIIAGLGELATKGLPPGYLLLDHLLYSLARVAWGFVIAALLGIPLGLLMGFNQPLRRSIGPVLEVLRPIPPLAWIPISILWFGIGMKSAAFIIFLGAFFPILLNTMAGVMAVSPALPDAARTLGASQRDLVLRVFLPGAVPAIFVGLRIGLGIGWMTLVAAEFTGVKSGFGLGYMIMVARDIARADLILAGMAVIGITGLVIDLVLRGLRSRLVRWQ